MKARIITKTDQKFLNKIETILMKSITKQLILTKKSKHFLIMYCYSYCDRLKNTPYALANFNELADNDLKYYLLNHNGKNTYVVYKK